MIYLILILVFTNNFLLLKYNLHIFQLNYYMPDTQLKWLFKNINKFILILIINLFQIYLIILNQSFSLIICLILLLINIYLAHEKNVIKKIVYTGRIKRIYLTNYLFFIIIYIIKKDLNILLIITLLTSSISTIYMIILNYINRPVNELINLYYINDAKKILKKMPNLKVIAITGSYGKTSTKNYLEALLSQKYNTLITPGNFNTRLGITRTIREHLLPTHEIFICEIGIDRVGQIEKTIKLINPDYAVITAIGHQHLETFKSIDNIINSKMKLTISLKEGGISFLNLDNDYINNFSFNKKEVIGYGLTNNINNNLKLNNIKYSKEGLNFKITKDKKIYEVNSKLLGEHNLINLYGAITIADYFNVPMKHIINNVKKIKNPKHRLNLLPGDKISIIDDSYNSNPVGAKNALKVLKEMDGLRILITPGMVELGIKEDEENYEFGLLATKVADYIYLINEKQTKTIYKAIKENKYDLSKVKIYNKFDSAMEDAKKIKTTKHKYILIENDLPDNFK
ncbi:MAG: UDP-N-acetylmuramoyl-tripeptide--D-alanyl-D-alanine ligase [Bacilli bacterium]|nr:UDP-N-acetylmuramoyl-tripeptide--D-alanyl-D-alanine ligase [Bacilli bacterium]